jgi:hypothetical protein
MLLFEAMKCDPFKSVSTLLSPIDSSDYSLALYVSTTQISSLFYVAYLFSSSLHTPLPSSLISYHFPPLLYSSLYPSPPHRYEDSEEIHTLQLTGKKLEAYRRESEQLFFSMNGAQIFFKRSDLAD